MPATTPALLQPGQTLVFEGDSLTRRSMLPCADNWPLLRMNNWHRSWAEVVEEWIFAHRPDLQIRCRHAAIGGSTIADLESRYEAQVKPQRPSWIFFTLGTNDCAQAIGVESFSARLDRYIRTAQADSGCRFFYVGGFLPMPGLGASETELLERAGEYYSAAGEVVRASGGVAPEIGAALKSKAVMHFEASAYHSFYGDDLHFNALGNHVLAGLVLEALGIFRSP